MFSKRPRQNLQSQCLPELSTVRTNRNSEKMLNKKIEIEFYEHIFEHRCGFLLMIYQDNF